MLAIFYDRGRSDPATPALDKLSHDPHKSFGLNLRTIEKPSTFNLTVARQTPPYTTRQNGEREGRDRRSVRAMALEFLPIPFRCPASGSAQSNLA